MIDYLKERFLVLMSSIFCVDRLKIVFFVFVVINLLFKWSIQWSFNDTDPVLRIRLNLIWTRSVPARKILFPVSLVLVLTEKCTRIKLFKKKYFHQQLLLNYVIKRPIPILFIKKDISMSPKNTHCLEILFFSCLLELL